MARPPQAVRLYFTQQLDKNSINGPPAQICQYMPRTGFTWWTEATFRHSERAVLVRIRRRNASGGNNGSPASCVGGGSDPNTGNCSAADGFPDLRTREVVVGAGVMVKF